MTLPTLSAPVRTRDFLDRLPLQRQAGKPLRRSPDGGVIGDWFGCELSSVFQPIVDPARGETVGHEAFLRIAGRGRLELSPWQLFSANADDDRLVALDRLARSVHALNFLAGGDDGLLFLNVHGRLLAAIAEDHGAAFRRVVDALGLPPDRVVIETPLAAGSQPDLLSFVLRNYRHNGFRVAVNVAAPGCWRRLAPGVPAHFIKIDAANIDLGSGGMASIEPLLDTTGAAQVVVTRVEAAPERLPDGVLAQGFAFGIPARRARRVPGSNTVE
ncbi:MAG: EAL domain-containing protein [Aromatoleum sp.]|jgi:EAL domain-containing protein (putative c-di-GMP-specific phosphodiesterase class I)|uniref:EAL domain-containing protein n=1 Tax=Aromatoleum sp. TaxID=2307007 RepID=UPI002895C469|nr:EAL domain-containing protein [Aromatoleum sp.]MDT3670349.1 EAL domain-containing protein [Aromatoleum sp.]